MEFGACRCGADNIDADNVDVVAEAGSFVAAHEQVRRVSEG